MFSGHEHVYERLKPEDNIYYFILGNSAKLMTHDFKSQQQMERSLDTEQGFMLIEISGDQLFYQAISRKGETFDSGKLQQQSRSSLTAAEVQ